MSRRGENFLDPDYRKKTWSKSALAPKNRPLNFNITRTSAFLTLVVFAPFAVPHLIDGSFWKDLLPYKFIIGPIAFWVVMVVIGLLLRSSLWIITRRKLKAEEPAELNLQAGSFAFSARQFEHDVAALIETLSGYQTEIVGGGGDQGVDIRVMKAGKLVGIVQCKYYSPAKTLKPGYVRELYAVKQKLGVAKAYLVTTARFSRQSVEEAQHFGIDLIDGERFRQLREQALRRGALATRASS